MASSHSTVCKTWHDLPFEITIEILSRLPVKSLLRFKSVCKTWYDLIETPDFISKHLETQVTLVPTSLLETFMKQIWDDHEMLLICNDGFNNDRVKLDFPFLDRRNNCCPFEYNEPSCVSVVGTCNGLVCIHFSHVGYPLILCNPSTRKFQEISGAKWNLLDDSTNVKQVSFGFGFHPRANDYKLIRIVLYSNTRFQGNIRADLYVMSTNTWTEIDVNKLSPFFGEINECGEYDNIRQIHGTSASAVLNGVFYWPARVVPTNQVVVMSFDMGDEVFKRIRTPVCLDRTWDETNWQFVELSDKLALVVSSNARAFDVWVLNEDKSSWTNQVKLGSFPRIATFMGYGEDGYSTVVGGGKNGELLVIEHKVSGDLKLFSYDTKTRNNTEIYFGKVSGEYSCVDLYVGTLLPVVQANEIVLNK